MAEHEVDRVPDGLDPGRLVLGHLDPVRVLELHHQLVEIERVGVEIVADKKTKKQYDPKKGVAAKTVAFAQEEGLIVRPLMNDRIAFCPPLIITAAEVDEGLQERNL